MASFGQVHTVTLPSGLGQVRAKRPSVLTLVAAGLFPSELMAIVWRMAEPKFDLLAEMAKPDSFRRYAETIEALVPHVLVEPSVGAATDAARGDGGALTGVVAIEDIDDVDKQHIYFFAIGAVLGDEEQRDRRAREVTAKDLEPFRGEPAGGPAGPGRDALQPAAVGAAGPGAGESGGA